MVTQSCLCSAPCCPCHSRPSRCPGRQPYSWCSLWWFAANEKRDGFRGSASLRGRRLLPMDERPSLALGSGQDSLPSGQGSASRRQARRRSRARAAGRERTIPAARPLPGGDFASPPSPRPDAPYIYCAAEAGWRARQLSDEQWTGIIRGLRQTFPSTRSWFTAQLEQWRSSRLTGRSFLTAKVPLESCSQRFPQPTW